MNTKWVSYAMEKIKRKLAPLRRNLQLTYANSIDYTATKSDWLQGRIMNRIRGSIINLYDSITFYKDKLGKWTAFHI